MNHLSPRPHLKSLHIWMKVLPPVGIFSERMMTMSYLQVRRKQTVNTWTDWLYQSWLRVICLTFFQRGPLTPMVSPRDYRLSRKSMLINVPGYLQSRKELYSSVFEEIHEHRIQSYKMLLEDFPLPSKQIY